MHENGLCTSLGRFRLRRTAPAEFHRYSSMISARSPLSPSLKYCALLRLLYCAGLLRCAGQLHRLEALGFCRQQVLVALRMQVFTVSKQWNLWDCLRVCVGSSWGRGVNCAFFAVTCVFCFGVACVLFLFFGSNSLERPPAMASNVVASYHGLRKASLNK